MQCGQGAPVNGAELNDHATDADPRTRDADQQIGPSVSDEDPARNMSRTDGYGQTAIGGRSAGASVSRPVSPQHRGTVKRFFEMERKEP